MTNESTKSRPIGMFSIADVYGSNGEKERWIEQGVVWPMTSNKIDGISLNMSTHLVAVGGARFIIDLTDDGYRPDFDNSVCGQVYLIDRYTTRGETKRRWIQLGPAFSMNGDIVKGCRFNLPEGMSLHPGGKIVIVFRRHDQDDAGTDSVPDGQNDSDSDDDVPF